MSNVHFVFVLVHLFYFLFLSTHFPRVSFTGYFVLSSSLSVFCISLCFLLSPPPAFHPFWLLSCCSFYLIPPVMDSRIIPPLKVERWSYFAFKVIFYQNKKKKEMEQRERWQCSWMKHLTHIEEATRCEAWERGWWSGRGRRGRDTVFFSQRATVAHLEFAAIMRLYTLLYDCSK